MRGSALLLAAVLVGAALAGCGATTVSGRGVSYPVGPTLTAFGLRERCEGQDQSCQDRARTVLEGILGELGDSAADPAVLDPNDPPPEGRLTITFDAQPPFEWRTQDGAVHRAGRVVLDLTGVVDGSEIYAVIGPGEAREIDPAQAAAVLDALFVLTD